MDNILSECVLSIFCISIEANISDILSQILDYYEELRAELGAAVLCNKFGMTKNIKSDSLPYIKSWLDNIHEKPELLKSILSDVKRSASIIGQRIDRIQVDIEKGIESRSSHIRNR